MIKIAFVIDTIASPTAGTEKQLLMLIKHLDRTRFQPHLCVLRSSVWLESEFQGCPVHIINHFSFKKINSWLKIWSFATYLRQEKVQIVQTHFRDGSIVGIIAARLAGVNKIISTRRNQGYWYNYLELSILRLLNKWVTLFIANSENTKQWATHTENIPAKKIKVIHNGLIFDDFFKGTLAQRVLFRKKLDFPNESIIIGIVANLRKVKAIDVFIKAAKIVSERCPHARFIVIGSGPEEKYLQSFCDEIHINRLVCFLGKRLDVADIMSCMDIGVLSSKSESFSNSIIEYMAASLAVICTDVGGAREAVEDGITGYIVGPGDIKGMAERLNKIINDNTYNEMGLKGREKALVKFSHKDVVNQYQHIYENL